MKHVYVENREELPPEFDTIIHGTVYQFLFVYPQAKELKVMISHLDGVLSIRVEEINTHFFLELRVTYLTHIETQSLKVVVKD